MKKVILRFGRVLSSNGGKISGEISGIPVTSPVEVLRDELGIPHIFADNELDLVTAQGFVHAQDRLWQMESGRRVASGRLAEAGGAALADLDHFTLLAGFKGIRDRAIATLTPENRKLLEAYAAGINAYIDYAGDDVPLEFKTLKLTPPRWSVDDLCGVLPLNAWFLQTNYHEEIVAVLARDRLTSEQFAELYPSGPDAKLPHEPFFERFAKTRVAPFLPAALAFYPELSAAGGGSNNWAIRHGEGGMPEIANDPHLAMTVPQVWHVCHLHCPTLNIAGVAMPGVPGIVIGRNLKLAWGVTNVMTDIVDLYMLRIDPVRPTRYRLGSEWREMEREEIRIPVRGGPTLARTIYRTVHGAVLTEVTEGAEAVVALKWYGTLPEAEIAENSINGFFSLFRSRTVAEAFEAGRSLSTVGQNLVCGDTAGDIGWHATGLVPVRRGYSGRAPADGSGGMEDDAQPDGDDWTGFLPYDQMPAAKNPPTGYLATANNRTVDDDYPHHITYAWTAPYRRERIAARLAQKLKAGVPRLEDMQEIQRDVYVLQAERLLPKLLEFEFHNSDALLARKILAEWDLVADRGSRGALIFSIFQTEFQRLLLAERLGAAFAVYISTAPLFYSAVDEALRRGTLSKLLEGTKYGANGLAALCEESLARAVAVARKALGRNIRRWHWGRLHTYLFAHPGATGPLTEWLLNRGPYAAPGTSTTVNVSAFNPANSGGSGRAAHARAYRSMTIPSMRFTASLADPDRTFIMAPMGQSGRPGNLHYDDMIRPWIEGEVVQLPLTEEAARRIARIRLVLRG